MKEIRQLVKIIRKKGQRSLQLVNQNFRKNETSKDNLLYESITSNELLTDEEAAQEIFGTDPSNRNYRNAKGKLKGKLFNHLYFLDYDKDIYSLYQKTEYESLHTLHQCKIMIMEGASEIALRLLPPLVKNAQEFELSHIAVEALEMLRDEQAKEGKLTPYKEASDELKNYLKFHEARLKCRDIYSDTIVYINKSVSAQNRIISKIPKAIESIRAEARKFNSKDLHVTSAKLEIIYNNICWKFRENVKLCTELEKKYLSCKNQEVNVDLDQKEIAFQKIQAYLNLNDTKAGKAYAKQKLSIFKPGSDEWFKFMEYYFLTLMKGESFTDASNVYRQVRTNKNYITLEDSIKDRWNIYRAYLIFFNDSKILRWGFNLEEFLGEVPCYQKEYNGYNAATLVIQFLFLLREGMVDQIRTCVEEAIKYKSAHLDKRHNYRSSIFIRLLEIVVEKEFDYSKIEEKGDTYYRKLLKTPIPSDLQQDTEIIPYENLWQHTLGILKTNKSYIHFRFYNIKAI
ncbi:MAG: hypothetical protein ACLFUB_17405 [Cyclobacteriaceae bacterium]